jgi:biopolymer transport protein ExbD
MRLDLVLALLTIFGIAAPFLYAQEASSTPPMKNTTPQPRSCGRSTMPQGNSSTSTTPLQPAADETGEVEKRKQIGK